MRLIFKSETKNQLLQGIDVEMEHVPTFKKIRAYLMIHDNMMPKDKDIARWIAEDHLSENKNYYKILKENNL